MIDCIHVPNVLILITQYIPYAILWYDIMAD